jgi:hypothetical protein
MLTSCAATHYTIRPVTAYVPAQDDGDLTCAAPLLIPAAVTDSVWARAEWWQSGSIIKADSLRTPRAVWLNWTPPTEVPAASKVTFALRLRDLGGTSCVATRDQTPTATAIKPAAASGLSVVP